MSANFENKKVVVSEIEEIASKTLSGIYVPIVGLLLILVFCFSFLGAKDDDDEEDE